MEPIVSIVMGSKSDLDIMSETAKVLGDFGVPHELHIAPPSTPPNTVALRNREGSIAPC